MVTYALPSGALGVAAVEKARSAVFVAPHGADSSLRTALTRCARPAQLRGGRAALCPLRLERDSGLWVEACHGSAASVDAPLSSLRRVDALYAQRAVADRVENPHGEHAENTWEARPFARCGCSYHAPLALSANARAPHPLRSC